ncbi:MAG: acyl-CoA dehydrogenase family protein [Paracoccaceae bacterium]
MLRESFSQPQTAGVSPVDWSAATHRLGLGALFDRLADGAAERDVQRRAAFDEVAELKALGFGGLRLVAGGLPLADFFAVVRDLGTADSNIAHVFRNHFFAVESHLKTPEAPFSAHILRLARDGAMFGVAFNEVSRDPAGGVGQIPAARLEPDGQGFRISGTKIYSTGNMYADYLFASATDAEGRARQFFIPTTAPGVVLDDDWDGFGQKLTGSGKTHFRNVRIEAADLFDAPQRGEDQPFLYGYTFHQIYLTTIISGIVNRILRDALHTVRGRSRNYYHALHEHPSQEPELQAVIGRIAAHRAAIEAVTDRAVAALNRAWAGADGPDAGPLSAAASIAAAEAKVVTDETAATLAGLLIDVSSGSGVTTARALDRHWRNIKVISAHNPRVYKERVLGDHYLNGTAPPTGAFF